MRVLVVGAGRTGVAVAQFFAARGDAVTITDSRSPACALPETVTRELGGHRRESFLGADLIVVSPGVPKLPELEAARAAGVRITGEIELAASLVEAPIVGVTGTNGKSTVTALAGAMAQASGRPSFVGGNLGTPLISAVRSDAASPEGLVVVELSSFQLETAVTLHPHAAAFLNLTPDHLDRYASVAEYGAAKLRLAENLGRDDVMVINADDEFFAAAGRVYKEWTRVLTYSTRGGGGAGSIDGDALVALGERYPIAELKLVGRHNLGNALAAILLMRGSDLCGYDEVRGALAAFRPLPHRMERVAERRGLTFYDDSKATNVDSVAAGLDGFPTPFVLIAGGRDKGGSYAPMVAAMRDNRCRAAVLIGEAADKIAAAIAGAVPVVRAASMDEAVRAAVAHAESGDAVLLSPACSSYDMFENYEQRARAFVAAVESL